MATNTETNILNVDASKAIDSLQKLRKEIKDLKDKLEGLDIGSKEYNKTQEDLYQHQTRLKGLMEDMKHPIDAQKDSYYALNKQLVEARKEYKNLSAAQRENAEIGGKLLTKIQGLSDTLTEEDAKMKQYYRNVGNYTESFAKAFEQMIPELKKVDGTIGSIAKDVKAILPLIKGLNTGIKGVGASLSKALGIIGLIGFAVYELVVNWKNVTTWIANAVTQQNEYNKVLKESETRLNAIIMKNAEYSKDWDAVERQRKILFEGYTEVTFAQERYNQALNAQETAIGENETALKEWMDAWSELNAAELESKNARTDGELVQAAARVTKAQEAVTQATINYGLAQKNLQVINEGVRTSEQNLANAKKTEENATKSNTKAHREAKSVYEGEKQAVDDLIRRIEAYRRAIGEGTTWQLEDDFSRDKALLDKALADGVIDAEKHAKTLKDLTWMFNRERVKILHQMNQELLEDTTKAYNEEMGKMDQLLADGLKGLKIEDRFNELAKRINTQSFGEKLADSFNNIFGSQDTINAVFDARATRLNDEYELERKNAEDKITLYKEQLEWWDELQQDEYERQANESGYTAFDYKKTEEYINLQKELAAEEMNLDNLKTQNFLDNADLEDERDEELIKAKMARWQLLQIGITATANLLNQFANIQQKQIQDDVKNGKISEKEARKKFKTVKSMQYAATVINTAQSAQAAYSAMASIPYVGPALGAAAALAATLSGLAQLKQIKAQEFSDTSSNTPATPNLTPVVQNTYTPIVTQNLTGDSELLNLRNAVSGIQPVVRITDVEDVQGTVKVREEENSF